MTHAKRLLLIGLSLLLSACNYNLAAILKPSTEPQHLVVKVLAKYPHSTSAFTEGLVYSDGKFYESAGEYGQSTLREVDAKTGKILRQAALPKQYFSEGIAIVDNTIIQMTWKEDTAFIYDLKTLTQVGTFTYTGDGWGMCYDGTQLYTSDGSSTLTVRNPKTFAVVQKIPITESGKPIDQLNELECVGDSLYENIWHADNILKIDKVSGRVTAVIDASGLLTPQEATTAGSEGVLNGIAYDPQKQDFFITGKLWPWMFEVQFVPAK